MVGVGPSGGKSEAGGVGAMVGRWGGGWEGARSGWRPEAWVRMLQRF